MNQRLSGRSANEQIDRNPAQDQANFGAPVFQDQTKGSQRQWQPAIRRNDIDPEKVLDRVCTECEKRRSKQGRSNAETKDSQHDIRVDEEDSDVQQDDVVDL